MDSLLYRLIEAGPLFSWDNNTRRFRSANGRFVSQAQVNSLRVDYIRTERAGNDRLAERLFNREIDINQWRKQMRDNLKRTYTIQYMLGKGGRGNMTQRDWGILGNMLRKQYNYVDKFAKDLMNGRYTENQSKLVAARQQLYAKSSAQAYERATAETYGPLQLPAWPGDGSTQCRSNCLCHWQIVRLKDGIISATWKLGITERHCRDCPGRAKAWRNLLFSPATGQPLQQVEAV